MSTQTDPYPDSPGDDYLAKGERARLCDLLDDVGPAAPTLCEGWDAHHLVAHLVIRESDPAVLLAVLRRGYGDKRVEERVGAEGFDSLVSRLRGGPPRLSPFGTAFTDKRGNGMEFFVHHEDVRRAVPGFTIRELPRWAHDELWSGLGLVARGRLRKAPVGIGLRRTDTGELQVVARRPGTVIVNALPAELALYVNGRVSVADIELDGRPEDIAALR